MSFNPVPCHQFSLHLSTAAASLNIRELPTVHNLNKPRSHLIHPTSTRISNFQGLLLDWSRRRRLIDSLHGERVCQGQVERLVYQRNFAPKRLGIQQFQLVHIFIAPATFRAVSAGIDGTNADRVAMYELPMQFSEKSKARMWRRVGSAANTAFHTLPVTHPSAKMNTHSHTRFVCTELSS